MEPDELLSTLATSAATATDAVAAVGLDAPVPTCPAWDLRSLLRHVGTVHSWVTHLVATAATAYVPIDAVVSATGGEPPDGDDDLVAWFDGRVQELARVLADRGPSAPVWNFADQQPVASFWFRRMAHETAMHAWDAANAARRARPLDAHLASDGIDELLTVMVPRRPPKGLAGSLHVHCTDAQGEWLVDLPSLTTRREHARGDVALRGPASDLLLNLAGRSDGGEVLGDVALLRAFRDGLRY
ncbi:MAG TPA: maleylpyruvate isomerase family mycothiol-dependent enzyme [Acidimicrobiales bacterium]|nr:maleylpyruvate isomerase family mycothiol-dependent enzyme [Acidimicrobiales bacterium]